MDYSKLPAINAALNASSGLLITLGWLFIRQRALTAHVMCMISACCTSVLFLISYIVYHLHHGATPFPHHGLIRPVYFTILISHTILAVVILPLVITSVVLGLKGSFVKHVKVSRVTFPLWLYVSVTGVVIYWMLYQL